MMVLCNANAITECDRRTPALPNAPVKMNMATIEDSNSHSSKHNPYIFTYSPPLESVEAFPFPFSFCSAEFVPMGKIGSACFS